MNGPIRCVLFDLGNVLIKIDFGLCFEAWSRTTGVPAARFRECFAHDETYARHERGEITGQEYHRYLCGVFGVQMSFEDFAAGWNALWCGVIPETQAFLASRPPGLRVAVFSNTNLLHYQDWSVRYAGAMTPFDRIYCSHELGLRKPDARAFELIIKDLGRDPLQPGGGLIPELKSSEVVFVDDLLENVRGAEAVGIRALHFQNAASCMAELRQLIQAQAEATHSGAG